LYIDSNIFIFASIDRTELGENCRTVLEMIHKGEIACASSYLTIDEIIWVLKKRIGKEKAVRIVKAAMAIPVRWMNIDRDIVLGMIEQFKRDGTDPRDSLHVASMRAAGITLILSEDSDFDKVDGLKRMDVSSFLGSIGALE